MADITYVPAWAGFVYLAIVLDAWSRRIVGWVIETHLRTELVLDALQMATSQREPEEVIHHSDQGWALTFKGSSQLLNLEVLRRPLECELDTSAVSPPVSTRRLAAGRAAGGPAGGGAPELREARRSRWRELPVGLAGSAAAAEGGGGPAA